MRRLIGFILSFTASLAVVGQAPTTPSMWKTVHPGLRVAGIATQRGSFWVGGAGGGIASSTDGEHWQIRHQHEDAGPLLLGIGFTSVSFGYAYGVAGAVLTTMDGGETWVAHDVETGTILAASFSAPYFGIVRTRDQVLYFNGTSISNEVPDQD